MPFHARDAARVVSATVKHVHVYIEKTMEKQRNRIKKHVQNYYCMSDISCIRVKTVVNCFTEPL